MIVGLSLLCIRAKLRASPKALVTKYISETLYMAWLMTQGMVISLMMIVIEMDDRGSKSNLNKKFVKEQRVDGSSYIYTYIRKVYSSRRETGSRTKTSNSRLKLP